MPVSPKTTDAPALMAAPICIYVHWPFCLSKCPYCDFNSHVRGGVDADRYVAALLREIDTFAERLPGHTPASIFFGGGTPSLMPPDGVARIIERILTRWPTGDDADVEITLEANPTSVEAGRFNAFRDAGVNRLSLGIQALHDDALKALGREHSASEALAALEIAASTFPRFSFDLIYARTGQTLADWRDELSRAVDLTRDLEIDHISLYQLTMEEGTPLAARHKRGEFVLPGENEAARLYDATQNIMDAAGLPAYEISNHARPGQESRHNLGYWQGNYYVGIGPGAHGRLPSPENGAALAHQQWRKPERWLSAVEDKGVGTEAEEVLTARERAEELVMTGLRLANGINRTQFFSATGVYPEDMIDAAALARMRDLGLVSSTGENLVLSGNGRQLLNAVLVELLG